MQLYLLVTDVTDVLDAEFGQKYILHDEKRQDPTEVSDLTDQFPCFLFRWHHQIGNYTKQ